MSTTDVFRMAQQGPTGDEEQGRLKADLQYLRRKGLLKAPGELSYQGRKCARCGAPFGRFYNTGASCTRCRHRVCRQCRIEVRCPTDNKDVEWSCNICYKIAELHIVTGKWTYETTSSKRSISGKTSFPVEILKHSIRRAWTINSPPTRWSAARKSPELRIYRSLPSRHQEYRDIINKNEIDREASAGKETKEQSEKCNDAVTRNEISTNVNERTNSKRAEKSYNKQDEEVPSLDNIKSKKSNRSTSTISCKTKTEEHDEASNCQEQGTPRISLLKPPRILSKFISSEVKSSQIKHGERKSNIPIFRRSSKEFEDIRSPQESPKRSLIPQRYRGSTDDLRRSREDISVPSLIPKLLSPRNKEDRLKRQDSKDDVRCKSSRKESKEETKNWPQSFGSKEESRLGIRIFRRDSSREDVGREVATKGKQEKQDVGVSAALKSKSKPSVRDSLDSKLKVDEEQDDGVRGQAARNEDTMLDVVVSDEKLRKEQEDVRKGEKEEREGKGFAESEDSTEDDKNTDSMKDTSESFMENADFRAFERKTGTDVVHGKKSEDFQVIRRKFSKEEFSNPDDTDDAHNKRCSSHLSPEASPLSTRSSRYSPRESESEPTPALPRKTGDSSSASQRIRDAITRTRRESNSSARYESSGSESIRLSETGIHGYTEVARKVKLFDGSGNGVTSSANGSDEVVQRDSATSAGEDESHDDNHGRTGPVSSQGRSIFRRRRQFDAQDARWPNVGSRPP